MRKLNARTFKASVKRIVNYLKGEELTHYEESYGELRPEDDITENHIYYDVLKLEQWLEKKR